MDIEKVMREQLARLTQDATWFTPLSSAMQAHWIDTRNREQFFLATCLYESDGFLILVENLNYSADGLLRVFRDRFSHNERQIYASHPEHIANHAYANRLGNRDEASGDGWRYRGRGLIQITGRHNYLRAAAATGLPLAEQPELLEEPLEAAEVSAWWWTDAGCNKVSDDGDFAGVQGLVNRGSRMKVANNMDERIAWLRKVQNAFGDDA